MISIIETAKNEIIKLCIQYKVKRLALFGSAATGEEFDKEKSDIDFLVEFQPLEPGTHADFYFGLLESMEKLLQRHVDLLMIRAIKNPYFLQAINKSRVVVYEAWVQETVRRYSPVGCDDHRIYKG